VNAFSLPRKLVVAGVIVDERGLVLITQRRADQARAGYWEFPGGTVEPGGGPAPALGRELAEGRGAAVEGGRVWDVLHHVYPTFELVMLVYRCRLAPGASVGAVEVADLRWVPPAELPAHDILPADQPLVLRLVDEGPPPWVARAESPSGG
jgi:8-oxo-dGTP diphosphatase